MHILARKPYRCSPPKTVSFRSRDTPVFIVEHLFAFLSIYYFYLPFGVFFASVFSSGVHFPFFKYLDYL
jgi:hypothetical protein